VLLGKDVTHLGFRRGQTGKMGGGKQEGRQSRGEDTDHHERMQPRRVALEEHVGEHKPCHSVSGIEVDVFYAGATDRHGPVAAAIERQVESDKRSCRK
jgi:hypothetical protein